MGENDPSERRKRHPKRPLKAHFGFRVGNEDFAVKNFVF
jgi:hypothetical protein